MKITQGLIALLREAADQAGNAKMLAKKSGVDAANISRYLNGRVGYISDDNWAKLAPFLPGTPTAPGSGVVENTTSLRRMIADAMQRLAIRSAEELDRAVGYGDPLTMQLLLDGRLSWQPEQLLAVARTLHLDWDGLPLGRVWRIPVVDWLTAADFCRNVPAEPPETIAVSDRTLCVAFRIGAHSGMRELAPGDLLLVRKTSCRDRSIDGKIGVVLFKNGGSALCGRFRRCEDGSVILAGDTADSPVRTLRSGEIEWFGCGVYRITAL